jgi:histidyl-tRNA synthetase
MLKPQTLKGFRDFISLEERKRQYIITTLKSIFKQFGFEQMETPALEYEEILAGKYGSEGEKLMYRFEDLGKRRVAMRYDQTVPLARLVAQYQNQITFPFKRYQISPVWRAENTQKGRYREFLQCDIDTVGTDSTLSDAEIIATIASAYKTLGFTNTTILINDREIFQNLSTETIIVIDKLEKIGKEGVIKELAEKKLTPTTKAAEELLESLLTRQPTQNLSRIMNALKAFDVNLETIKFSPTLARGLDYYTGLIFEIKTPDYPYGSLAGGGRYDNLIGMFTKEKIPAVGLSIGFDRTLEAMDALQLFPAPITNSTTKILVTIFSSILINKSSEITTKLRHKNINAEIYLGEIKEKNPLEKQLKYADQKGIKYCLIIGPEEIEKNIITLKNLQTRKQQQLTLEELIKSLRASPSFSEAIPSPTTVDSC